MSLTIRCPLCGTVLTGGSSVDRRGELLALCLACYRRQLVRLGDWPTADDIRREREGG